MKFEAMFERRASQGQCFVQPYLGCREFTAYFELLETQHANFQKIFETRDLGWMLYDLEYTEEAIKPKFFKATMRDGVIIVPSKSSAEVRG